MIRTDDAARCNRQENAVRYAGDHRRRTNGVEIGGHRKTGMTLAKPQHTTIFLTWLIVAESVCAGGTVTFDPPVATASQGDVVEFVVTVSSTDMAEFEWVYVLLSSDIADLNLAFTFDSTFDPSFPSATPITFGLFESDVFVSGFKIDLWQAPLTLGVLRVDTSAMSPGTYPAAVGARPGRETEATLTVLSRVELGFGTEELSGAAEIVILNPDSTTSGGESTTDIGDGASSENNDDNTQPSQETGDDGTGDNPDGENAPAPGADATEGGDTNAGATDEVIDGGETQSAPTITIPMCGAGMLGAGLVSFVLLLCAGARRGFCRS